MSEAMDASSWTPDIVEIYCTGSFTVHGLVPDRDYTLTELIAMAEEQAEKPKVGQRTDVQKHVDTVIQDLADRKVDQKDRIDLRRSLDKADAPLSGRPAADSAIGRISRGW